jgi:hypothetical protein
MNRLMLLFLLLMTACSSAPTKGEPHFFLGRASDDCDFVGYIDGAAQEKDEDRSLSEAKKRIIKQAEKSGANMLKIVNVNRMLTSLSLSAEAYRCSSLLRLKIADDAKLDF